MEGRSGGEPTMDADVLKTPSRWPDHPMIRVERRTAGRAADPICFVFVDDTGEVDPTVFFFDQGTEKAEIRPDNCRGFMKYPSIDALTEDGWQGIPLKMRKQSRSD